MFDCICFYIPPLASVGQTQSSNKQLSSVHCSSSTVQYFSIWATCCKPDIHKLYFCAEMVNIPRNHYALFLRTLNFMWHCYFNNNTCNFLVLRSKRIMKENNIKSEYQYGMGPIFMYPKSAHITNATFFISSVEYSRVKF